MLADIGNGTMNIMYINNSRPLEKKCFTEKYGTHQCVLAVRESLLKELGTVVDDLVIEQVIRTGTADIGEKYLTVIRKAFLLKWTGIIDIHDVHSPVSNIHKHVDSFEIL